MTADEQLRLECARVAKPREHSNHAATTLALYDFITEGPKTPLQRIAAILEDAAIRPS
jgi:hypothetical protein